MNRSELMEIINTVDHPDFAVVPDRVMDVYHRLEDLNELCLGELVDDYILRKHKQSRMFSDTLSTYPDCSGTGST